VKSPLILKLRDDGAILSCACNATLNHFTPFQMFLLFFFLKEVFVMILFAETDEFKVVIQGLHLLRICFLVNFWLVLFCQ